MTPTIIKTKKAGGSGVEFAPEFSTLLESPHAGGILRTLFYDVKNITITSKPGPRSQVMGPYKRISAVHKGWDVAPFHIDNCALVPLEQRTAVIDGVAFQLKQDPKGFGYYLKADLGGAYLYVAHLDLIEKVEFGSVSRFVRVGSSGNSTGNHVHLEWRSHD